MDEQAAKRQSELLAQLNTAIADYKMAVEGGGASGGTSASYSVVTLTSGQTLALGVGCEVMLRVGTATLAANTDPGLIDVSTGGTLNNGGALTANHLYMATIADRTVQATAATVKLLVRGGTPSPETGAQTEGPACLFDMPGPSIMIEAERTESPGDGRVREWRRIFPAEGDTGREERTCLWLLKCFWLLY